MTRKLSTSYLKNGPLGKWMTFEEDDEPTIADTRRFRIGTMFGAMFMEPLSTLNSAPPGVVADLSYKAYLFRIATSLKERAQEIDAFLEEHQPGQAEAMRELSRLGQEETAEHAIWKQLKQNARIYPTPKYKNAVIGIEYAGPDGYVATVTEEQIPELLAAGWKMSEGF